MWGASSEDWLHFDLMLGQTANLLPVVSNPEAKISPASKMKQLGKTPSLYNQEGLVVGLSKWTQKKTTSFDLGQWLNKDYGICIQTKEVRGLDIDIKDPVIVKDILESLADKFPFMKMLPRRTRSNSASLLVAFILKGEFPKRVIKTEHGIIEFLANGQQFVAVGTHPSGVRYEWEGGLPCDIPEISQENFESLWSFLKDKYSVSFSQGVMRQRGENLNLADPVLEALEVLDYGADGQVFIRCPFEEEHTTDSGIAATCYFPAGTNGYLQGHFKCLHAHCAGRSDVDFLDALGIRASHFDVVVAEKTKPLPAFSRNKQGRILATRNNIDMALSREDICGVQIHYDTFSDDIMIGSANEWRPLKDTDYTTIMLHLEKHSFEHISFEVFRQGLHRVADCNQKDGAIAWLNQLKWDGVPRVSYFMRDYFATVDSEYTRGLSRYIWTALAGRVLVGGIKADMIPVIEGKQGLRKSTAIEAISPSREFFRNISFSEKDEEKARKLRSCMVAEIAELNGLHTREVEEIKAWVTRTHEEWTPKYKERMHTFPRRCIFFGTTNEIELFSDPTGNRRWLPIHVDDAKVEKIIEDRDQLWAEAKMEFELFGIDWGVEKEVDHTQYTRHDPWYGEVVEWLDQQEGKAVTAVEVLKNVLYMSTGAIKPADIKRVNSILMMAGYVSKVINENGHYKKTWSKK